jgi:hypothetical protein
MTRPLAGRTVLVTRPAHQAAALAQAIRAAGGEAFGFPALAIEPVPAKELAASLAQLRDAGIVIFISPNAAQFGMAAIAAAGGLPAAAEVFAVGPGTARASPRRAFPLLLRRGAAPPARSRSGRGGERRVARPRRLTTTAKRCWRCRSCSR